MYKNKREEGRAGRAGKPELRPELVGAAYGAIEHGDTGE